MSLLALFRSLFGKRSEESVPPPEVEPPLALPPAKEAAEGPPEGVDFVAVLEAAGVNASQRSMVTRAQDLLRTLPAETPSPVKRDIVEAAFKAFDIPTEEIVVAASSEIAALTAFTDRGEEQKNKRLAEGEKRIADLEIRIAEEKAAMADAVALQESRAEAAREVALKVQPVLEFFKHEAAPAAPAKGQKAPEAARAASQSEVEIEWEGTRD